ncbi:hypothetical protein HPP92_019619 [Vanilla planifolia]|uniref:Uncharacterized protein n=1 Tax=Vanilla planifolia TaxID=51239 RepID=A0A835Q370_VANPL|nr:hypothetical protein HPP92_019619 [Vanilla planifolia]
MGAGSTRLPLSLREMATRHHYNPSLEKRRKQEMRTREGVPRRPANARGSTGTPTPSTALGSTLPSSSA